MKRIFIYAIFLLSTLCAHAQVEVTYDFNALTTGNLAGQDDWVSIQATAGTADFQVDASSGAIVSPDGTLAAFYNAGGPNVGRTATRKATFNFNFNFTSGGAVELEFDMLRNYWGAYFGVGFDADFDGVIAPGIPSEPNDGGILLNVASNLPATNNFLMLPNGSKTYFDDNTDGWCRYKLIFDFGANAGEGAVALYYKPGTVGPWLAINEVQGLNMHLTPGSATKSDYLHWDGLFFHSQGATGGFDNILVRQPPTGQQYQFINFPTMVNKLTSDPDFTLGATTTSGLQVVYEIVSGPASVMGNVVTLSGQAGTVQVKASQPGNGSWVAAPDVMNSFEVIDAGTYYADLKIRRPADTTKVFMSELSPIMLVAEANVLHPDVLSVLSVGFDIQGNVPNIKHWNNGYYATEWTPPAYGTYTLTVSATITGGNVTTHTSTFEVMAPTSNQFRHSFSHDTISQSNSTAYGTFIFPTFAGAFDTILGHLMVTCPVGGCDPWDRVGSVEARAPTGEWIEIFRYITPYNTVCGHTVDLTDYASILQGAVDMRFNIGTQGNGFVVDLTLNYKQGEPAYKYSWVQPIWELQTFPFGDMANLQPIAPVTWSFLEGTEKARLKIINTGHGWGDNNTGNAAEFYSATHNIKINGTTAYTQNLWVVCNPNPDGCQPQNGTWYYARAGWCPGSIPPFWNYDLTSYIGTGNLSIFYEFDPSYKDMCHPNNPNCVTGVTCPDCNDTYNPVYIVTGNMISYGNNLVIGISDLSDKPFQLRLFPNPARDVVTLAAINTSILKNAEVRIFTSAGQLRQQFDWNGEALPISLDNYAKGIYILQVRSSHGLEIKKLIIN